MNVKIDRYIDRGDKNFFKEMRYYFHIYKYVYIYIYIYIYIYKHHSWKLLQITFRVCTELM